MDNVSLVKNLYDAFGRGDIPSVLGAMSPDAVLNNLFIRLGAEWDGFTVHPKSFHNAGGSIIVEVRYSGRYKATGRKWTHRPATSSTSKTAR